VGLIEPLVDQPTGVELMCDLSCREELGDQSVKADLVNLGKLLEVRITRVFWRI